MKKIVSLMIAFALVFSFAGLVSAAKKSPMKVMQASGEITAVDAKTNTFTLKTKKGDITCEVGADAKITSGKESKTLADVKVGDKAACKYAMEGDKHICKSLDIKAAK